MTLVDDVGLPHSSERHRYADDLRQYARHGMAGPRVEYERMRLKDHKQPPVGGIDLPYYTFREPVVRVFLPGVEGDKAHYFWPQLDQSLS